ncbi:endolytic transglycosylase MltG [Paenibacillus sp. FSL H8-0315]|uniref:endolytic transglycosylase MltG n=1 Tax=Paenibacillus sp. FSL H8-0315 TaxID=2921384 RepID=UPI0030FA8150
MIKNRSFLFGLGTGLITGALLLQLMISGGAAPLTKEQVLQGAEKLNMKVIDEAAVPSSGETENDNKEEVTETGGATAESKENVSSSAPAAAASPTPAVSPTTPESSDKAIAPNKPSTPTNGKVEQPKVTPKASAAPTAVAPVTPKVTANASVSVRIPSGSTLTATTDILAKAGVIKDKSTFLEAANKRKINTKIQSGSYSFNKGESIDSIIEKLITLK